MIFSGIALYYGGTYIISSLFMFSIFFSPLPSSQGWLCDVESMMHATLKDILRACRIDLKKHLNKRDKWIRDWPGQVGEETDFSSLKTLFSTVAHFMVAAASDRKLGRGLVMVVVSMERSYIMSCLHCMCWVS